MASRMPRLRASRWGCRSSLVLILKDVQDHDDDQGDDEREDHKNGWEVFSHGESPAWRASKFNAPFFQFFVTPLVAHGAQPHDIQEAAVVVVAKRYAELSVPTIAATLRRLLFPVGASCVCPFLSRRHALATPKLASRCPESSQSLMRESRASGPASSKYGPAHP